MICSPLRRKENDKFRLVSSGKATGWHDSIWEVVLGVAREPDWSTTRSGADDAVALSV